MTPGARARRPLCSRRWRRGGCSPGRWSWCCARRRRRRAAPTAPHGSCPPTRSPTSTSPPTRTARRTAARARAPARLPAADARCAAGSSPRWRRGRFDLARDVRPVARRASSAYAARLAGRLDRARRGRRPAAGGGARGADREPAQRERVPRRQLLVAGTTAMRRSSATSSPSGPSRPCARRSTSSRARATGSPIRRRTAVRSRELPPAAR